MNKEQMIEMFKEIDINDQDRLQALDALENLNSEEETALLDMMKSFTTKQMSIESNTRKKQIRKRKLNKANRKQGRGNK